ncbi:MAG: hypothetical protein NWF09_09415 [Candidatus Bathyarchaeota archaeon]|nr:hypothetical protein [Candidatus Bathyarchaeota archaeon]
MLNVDDEAAIMPNCFKTKSPNEIGIKTGEFMDDQTTGFIGSSQLLFIEKVIYYSSQRTRCSRKRTSNTAPSIPKFLVALGFWGLNAKAFGCA